MEYIKNIYWLAEPRGGVNFGGGGVGGLWGLLQR